MTVTSKTSKASKAIIRLGEEFRYYRHPDIHIQNEYALVDGDGDGDELGVYEIEYAGNDDTEILSELILWYEDLGQYKPENLAPSKFLEVFQAIFESGAKQGKQEQLKVFKKFIQEQNKPWIK